MKRKQQKIYFLLFMATLSVALICTFSISNTGSFAKYVINRSSDIVNVNVTSFIQNYVYVDGIFGDNNNDGSTKNQAVKDLSAAYSLLKNYDQNGAVYVDGKSYYIIVCGDLSQPQVSDSSMGVFDIPVTIISYPVGNGLVFRGDKWEDVIENYDSKITIDGSENYIFADTTFKNINMFFTANDKTLFANFNKLTFGEGLDDMGFSNSSSFLSVVGGSKNITSDMNKEVNLVIESGKFKNIYGDVAEISSNILSGPINVVINGTAQIADQLIGVHGNHNGNINISVSGAYLAGR